MIYVIWRLHRTHVLAATTGLAALVAVLVVTGISMANTYDTATASCAASHSCSDLPSLLFQNDSLIIDVVSGTMILPAVLGVLWGAPLVAGELEAGTHDLVWTQSITRRRWMATNIAWAIVVAIVWGAVLTLLVSWWRIPENGLFDRLSPGVFAFRASFRSPTQCARWPSASPPVCCSAGYCRPSRPRWQRSSDCVSWSV